MTRARALCNNQAVIFSISECVVCIFFCMHCDLLEVNRRYTILYGLEFLNLKTFIYSNTCITSVLCTGEKFAQCSSSTFVQFHEHLNCPTNANA